MATTLPVTKKRRVETMNLFNDISQESITFIFSFLDLLDIIKSICIVNKEFNHYINECSTHLWREYCELHGIHTINNNSTWILTAKQDIRSNVNIEKLINWKFPTLYDDRYDIKSKYMNEVISDGLIEYKRINDIIYEYDSIDLLHSSLSSKVKCDNKEIHIIDSFIVNSFHKLRSLGNIEPDSHREFDDIWDGYKKRGDFIWKAIDMNANTIKTWLNGALLPGEYTYNLYCINNRNGRGKWSSTDKEKKEDESYIETAENFIKLFIDTFCMDNNDRNSYRFYCAGHVQSEMLDLDRDEMIVAVNNVKIFAFYAYYSRCYG